MTKISSYSLPLQYVRSALFSYCALPVWTTITCLLALPLLLAPRPWFMGFVRFWARGVCCLEAWILNLRYEIRGLEHLPDNQRCIIAAKHQSTYETLKAHILFRDTAIILKKELFCVPIWGQFLMKTDVIGIDRGSPKKAMASVNTGAKRVAQDGRSILIYPQGTRVKPGVCPQEVPYKFGALRIQDQTGLPLIPFATNSGCFWPKGDLLKKPGTVVFEFLPALPATGDRQARMDRLQDALEGASNRLAEETFVATVLAE